VSPPRIVLAVVLCHVACHEPPATRDSAAPGAEGARAAVGVASASPAVAASGAPASSPGAAPAPSAQPGPSLPREPLAALAVPGFRDAVVSFPSRPEKAPLLVALHGNYDRPEWQCDVWRGVTQARAFVLCPRGDPRTDAPRSEDRWTWNAYAAVEREVDAALAAARSTHDAFVAPGPPILAGFSLGATMAARLAVRSREPYSRLVLVEGGNEGWTRTGAKTLAARAGARVLGGCGQPVCRTRFAAAGRVLEAAGVALHVADGGAAGHTYDGPVAAAVAAEWEWFVGDD
jgi:predicted esterase